MNKNTRTPVELPTFSPGLDALSNLFIAECICNMQLNNTALEKGKFLHIKGHGFNVPINGGVASYAAREPPPWVTNNILFFSSI